MDQEGYVYLSEFSPDKIFKKQRCDSVFATPEYMAPELIHPRFRPPDLTGKEADWYSFGVIMF
jgi:serine/threonine protein kinase